MGFYVLDENNNKHEALDKEGVLNAINAAIQNGSLASLVADAGFISKLKCCVSGSTNKIGFITQAKYNELEANDLLERNTIYFITDDTLADDLEEQLSTLTTTLKRITEGTTAVPKATDAENVTGTIRGVAIDELLVFDDGDQATPVVWDAKNAENADAADKVNGTLITPTTNSLYGSVVPLTKAGLYVCTIKQTYTVGSTKNYYYLTALISVPNLNYNCSSHIISSNDATGDNRLVIYYSVSGKYLQLYDNTDDATYKFEFYNCQLITEY